MLTNHSARPAFDCRGSVKISFVRSTRTIDVKYEHTPLHKTVGELIDLLAPPPPAPVSKTPVKKPKEPKPKEPKETNPRTSKPSKRGPGENGVPLDGKSSRQFKKRRKKDSLPPGAGVIPSEMPNDLPVGELSTRPLYNSHSEASTHGQPAGSSSYPEALVSTDGPAPEDVDALMGAILNLPPREIQRRRDVAIKLLTNSGIDPKTLTAEQFNIFANQSPELQQDSLAMFMKYGAERLRIVHPNQDSTPAATPNKNGTSAQSAGQSPTVKHKKLRKKTSEVAAADVVAGEGTPVKQARSICDNCRIMKLRGKVRTPCRWYLSRYVLG